MIYHPGLKVYGKDGTYAVSTTNVEDLDHLSDGIWASPEVYEILRGLEGKMPYAEGTFEGMALFHANQTLQSKAIPDHYVLGHSLEDAMNALPGNDYDMQLLVTDTLFKGVSLSRLVEEIYDDFLGKNVVCNQD